MKPGPAWTTSEREPRAAGATRKSCALVGVGRRTRYATAATATAGSATIGVILVVLVCLVTGAVAGLFAATIRSAPSPQDIDYRPSMSTKVYDVHGKLITSLFVEDRVWVPLSEIPRDLQNAFIAHEDERFYRHPGIDLKGIARALLVDLMHGGKRVQGGSTITQQLARQAFLTLDKTVSRKLQEAVLALQLERRYSKEEILELYLNQIYFGHASYGVEAAANVYFGKHVRDLSLPECALLAAIPRGPGYYSPYINPKAAKEQRDLVLRQMEKLGYIGAKEAEAARQTPIKLAGLRARKRSATYFIDYVVQQLLDRYGENMVYRGGLRVYTTLDMNLQETAERILFANLPEGTPDKNGVTQPEGALVAMDVRTGEIRAMVGGRGEDKYNRAVMAHRQPGSAIKPIVYTAAIDNGYTPATVFDDSPVQYRDYSGKVWSPQNVDGKFRGPTPLREALERSVNVVSVKLLDQLGTDTAIRYAKKMGITSLVESGPKNDHTLTLVLGGLTRGVTPLEMAQAYGVLANQGIKTTPYAISQVVDQKGNVLERNIPQKEIVLSEQTAYVVTDMLRGVIERGTGKNAAIGRPAAGKTGTTTDYTNAWFVGYTPELVASVWIGNDIQVQPMVYKGVKIGSWKAAQIWGLFMREALKKTAPSDFPAPSGIVYGLEVCSQTGDLATPECPARRTELFISGTEPTRKCDLHSTVTEVSVCADSGMLATANCPPDRVEIRRYLKASRLQVLPDGTVLPDSVMPTLPCSVHQTTGADRSAPTEPGPTLPSVGSLGPAGPVGSVAPAGPASPAGPADSSAPTAAP